MEIWREEVFGPVLCVYEFSTEDEAIELSNDTQWATCFFSTVSMSSAGLQLIHSLAYELISQFLFDSYGLAGAVISNDRERCRRLSEVCTIEGVYSIWRVTWLMTALYWYSDFSFSPTI